MTYTQEELNLITLDSFTELTYNQKSTLLGSLSAGTPDFVKYRGALIKNVGDGVYNKVERNFASAKYRQGVLESLKKRGISCVTYFSGNYPELLRQTEVPPIVLYCKGNIELLNTRCFAVVGSRRTPANIAAECTRLTRELSEYFTIVSGVADGGDTAAVTGALDSGKVICVLANGFDHIYPAISENLIKSVAEKGLLVTEYTPQVPTRPYHFPVRNRIIAGLAEGTLVISAGEKSGTLTTAEYAVEYSRHLFAFPYGIGAVTGKGCNALIKKGAFLTDSIRDIFDIFGIEPESDSPQKSELKGLEKELYEAIKLAGEAFLPDVAAKLNKQPYELIAATASLEIKGKLVRLGGNRYSAI